MCGNCTSTSSVFIQPYEGSASGFLNKTLVRCTGCGLITMYPLPTSDELDAFYASYWLYRINDRRLQKMSERAKARARFLEPYLAQRSTLRVVDVGAGFGHLLTALRELGPRRRVEYAAVEVDAKAIEHLTHNLGVQRIFPRIEDCPDRYDLMVMSHFLEHIPDPVAYLRTQRDKLDDDGLLFAEVPHADYRFKHQHQPHLTFFEVDTLRSVVESAGYAVVRLDTCGPLSSSVARAAGKVKREERQRSLLRRATKRLRQALRGSRARTEKASPDLDAYGGDRRWIRIVARCAP